MQIKKPEFMKIAMVFSCILLLNDAVMYNSETGKCFTFYVFEHDTRYTVYTYKGTCQEPAFSG